MKKRICCALIVICLLAAFAPQASAAVYHNDVRVLLSTGGADYVKLSVSGEYYLAENPNFIIEEGTVKISVLGNRPLIRIGEETFSAASITLVCRDYGGTSSTVSFRNYRHGACAYLGNLTFTASGGELRVVNTLPIEQYLYGVVAHEMSNTFPLEALKAQAVCARGYAVSCCSENASRSYDILDTSQDQTYEGYTPGYTRAIAAVDETAGQLLTYDDEIIKAYYSASNGGQTELTGNVWQSNMPYYIQQDDEYDLANASSLVEKSFIPAEFTPETVVLMDEIVLTRLQAAADGAAGEAVTLISTVYVRAKEARYDPPSRCYTAADAVLMVQNAAGETGQVTVTLSLSDLVHSDDDADGIFNAGSYNLRMRGAEAGVLTVDGTDYTGWFLTNRRYGHGIGLSQRGAQQRATAGIEYADILAFYYANTLLFTVGNFDTAPAITSEDYTVAAQGISGVQPGSSAEKLLRRLDCEEGELALLTSAGAPIDSGNVGSGDVVRISYGTASCFDLPVIIYGDVTGDGKISEADVTALVKHLNGEKSLSGARLIAADADHSGAVSIADVLQLIRHINGDIEIQQTDAGGEGA